MDKRYHELAKKQAANKEIESCTIYGQPALGYTKREIVAMLILMMKEREEDIEFHSRSLQLMVDLGKARRRQ